MDKLLFLIILTMFLFDFSFGLVISEIHANPEGTDKGFEWIEIYNNESTNVDISGWSFFEEDTNHKLTVVKGSFNLGPEEIALIAENPENFSQKFTDSGNLIDSSWSSLKNSGEFLAIKNSNDEIVDGFSYFESAEGKSICRNLESNKFAECVPSPGVYVVEKTSESSNKDSKEVAEEKPEEIIEDTPTTTKEAEKVTKKEAIQKNDEVKIDEIPQIINKPEIFELETFGKASFNDFMPARLIAENVNQIFVHIEDNSGKNISHTATFTINEGRLNLDFIIFVFSSCGQNFESPFYLKGYYDDKKSEIPLEFREEICSKSEDILDDNLDERVIEEVFPEESLTGNLESENSFVKFFKNIGDWFMSLFS